MSSATMQKAELEAAVFGGEYVQKQVLDGVIRRGEGQDINAVLWFSDIRDYTRLSENLPPGRVLAMLNAYYEAVGNALRRQGGEILKFIGDGVMAIFPIVDAMFLPAACAGAPNRCFPAGAPCCARWPTIRRRNSSTGSPSNVSMAATPTLACIGTGSIRRRPSPRPSADRRMAF